jgi:hypothetical protein
VGIDSGHAPTAIMTRSRPGCTVCRADTRQSSFAARFREAANVWTRKFLFENFSLVESLQSIPCASCRGLEGRRLHKHPPGLSSLQLSQAKKTALLHVEQSFGPLRKPWKVPCTPKIFPVFALRNLLQQAAHHQRRKDVGLVSGWSRTRNSGR